nr:MAG TPA: hypothetical protein [Crassvirales sp.]
MKKISNYIKDSLMWLWQFPQNILALCIEGILCQAAYREGKVDGNTIIVNSILPPAMSFMSLGDYIFVNPMSLQKSTQPIQHEFGHSKQSDILGPLYLIVIGIPSLLHNIVYYLCSKIGIKWNYYSFYTESWANKLVGITI